MESGARAGRRQRMVRSESEAEFARVLAFSDGVFSIAITLLVLQLEVPEDVDRLGHELADQLPDLFAFALSFAVLGRIWWAFHHRLFSGLEAFDGRLIGINFLYLALAVLVPFSSELVGDYGDRPQAVITYAANLGLLSLVGAEMLRYATRNGLMRPEVMRERGLAVDYTTYLIPAVFLGSIPIALLSPVAATWMWVLSFVIGRPLRHRIEARRARRDEKSGASGGSDL